MSCLNCGSDFGGSTSKFCTKCGTVKNATAPPSNGGASPYPAYYQPRKSGKKLLLALLVVVVLGGGGFAVWAFGFGNGMIGGRLDGTWIGGSRTYEFSGSNAVFTSVIGPYTQIYFGTFSVVDNAIEFVWTSWKITSRANPTGTVREHSPPRVQVRSFSRTRNTLTIGDHTFIRRQ